MNGIAEAANELGKDSRFAEVLKRYWGYDEFRPKQEEIVRNLSAGRDVCVVMPTGAGKSLCYQLPAVLEESRTAVVISPLIALMQDQVAQLQQMGIPAVFLNSAVVEAERNELKRRVAAGEFRLIYVSPERAVTEGTAEWLKRVPVSFFAIDEAHCISEWGHDFRPEYRQLSKLRIMFPERPIAAFTASATQQVRRDIVEQLHLRDPLCVVMSFHRKNLRYVVKLCQGGGAQDAFLLEALNHTPEGNVIVYAPTVARVGEVVDLLGEHGIPAVDYHGQMDSTARRENQEKWMSEEVRVLVGTIAFGLGINKPNVRAVIRLGLPDSIEQLYQETGRAGRDGLSADCYLFWEWKDKRLREYFMNKIGDSKQFAAAQQRFALIESFAKNLVCRQKQICNYFGEILRWDRCLNCDNCGSRGPGPDFAFQGAKHRPFLAVNKKKEKSVLSPLSAVERELWDYLREWRTNAAKERKLPAFVVMHDSVLDEICRRKPKNTSDLATIPGIGKRKLESYGLSILEAVGQYNQGTRASSPRRPRWAEFLAVTKQGIRDGKSFAEIAKMQGCEPNWVMQMVGKLVEGGELDYDERWVEHDRCLRIQRAAERLGVTKLKPIREALPEEIGYGEINLVVGQLRRQKESKRGIASHAMPQVSQ